MKLSSVSDEVLLTAFVHADSLRAAAAVVGMKKIEVRRSAETAKYRAEILRRMRTVTRQAKKKRGPTTAQPHKARRGK